MCGLVDSGHALEAEGARLRCGSHLANFNYNPWSTSTPTRSHNSHCPQTLVSFLGLTQQLATDHVSDSSSHATVSASADDDGSRVKHGLNRLEPCR